ncbi:tyrosine protein phosphatase [Paenibacillus doosanensis]|uniref:tyrosine-protein phosphatase n=1 Tax=Paenibacillus doosanensis TaxID=1229154 RepID=UPI0021803038|nr:CpsB/CapC family capsule biosynthesis tyrosine phosphatase [Paenibacillus doosanensis]MCS7459905.1 tyrosine protein phosphatase [Paenibacillus doosanensis]
MIDIHSHLIPGIDDGAKDMEESIAMARAAVEEGIHTLIATPHHANGKYDNPWNQVVQAVREVNEALETQGIPLTVLSGQEIRVYDRLLEDLHNDIAGTLHSTPYILIEFPTREIPRETDSLFHELRVMGLIPVIAHPERNVELAESPSKLERLIRQGALSQITSHSINGLFGKKIQKLSLEMCKHHLAHFIASDAHNMKYRAFGLREAYALLARQLGDRLVQGYMDNAEKLVRGEAVQVPEPGWREKAWWKFW